MNRVDPNVLQGLLSRHLAMYKSKVPYYQATMLNSLDDVWVGRHERLLDVGGGTGVIAQAVSELFPVKKVEAVDLVDRFCEDLTIAVQQYDGQTLPYPDDHFDAAMLNNVLHHVPVEARASLLREIRRAVKGPLYIKDHEKRGIVDTLRLTILDAIGNIPFGGMLWARYLDRREWEDLAKQAGYTIAAHSTGSYRSGLHAWLFPNRLETTMRLDPV